jgi:hypothetical protein
LAAVVDEADAQLATLATIDDEELEATILDLTSLFNQLIDVDKHYLRKEYRVY